MEPMLIPGPNGGRYYLKQCTGIVGLAANGGGRFRGTTFDALKAIKALQAFSRFTSGRGTKVVALPAFLLIIPDRGVECPSPARYTSAHSGYAPPVLSRSDRLITYGTDVEYCSARRAQSRFID